MSRFSELGHQLVALLPDSVLLPCGTGHFAALSIFYSSKTPNLAGIYISNYNHKVNGFIHIDDGN
jgi:hypothetical protein